MLVCGWVFNILQSSRDLDYLSACRVMFFFYAGMGLLKLILTLFLSERVERDEPETSDPARQPLLQDGRSATSQEPPKKLSIFSLDRHTKRLMVQLSFLFALDSFASGLAPL